MARRRRSVETATFLPTSAMASFMARCNDAFTLSDNRFSPSSRTRPFIKLLTKFDRALSPGKLVMSNSVTSALIISMFSRSTPAVSAVASPAKSF